MAHERLGIEEILNNFIIYHSYGTSGAFPYGAGSTIVLSKVSCENDGDSWSMVSIHRNQDYQIHAETKLLQLLKDISDKAKQIKIEMIQNFSPCNDKNHEGKGAFCAQKIVDYKKEMKRQGKQIDISITFANFYRTVVYNEHGKYGNNANRAEQNKNGLRLLRDNGVQLRLLCGKEEWKKFLNDDQLVSLSEDDKYSCLQLALQRTDREKFDEQHFNEILCTLEERFSQLQVSDPPDR